MLLKLLTVFTLTSVVLGAEFIGEGCYKEDELPKGLVFDQCVQERIHDMTRSCLQPLIPFSQESCFLTNERKNRHLIDHTFPCQIILKCEYRKIRFEPQIQNTSDSILVEDIEDSITPLSVDTDESTSQSSHSVSNFSTTKIPLNQDSTSSLLDYDMTSTDGNFTYNEVFNSTLQMDMAEENCNTTEQNLRPKVVSGKESGFKIKYAVFITVLVIVVLIILFAYGVKKYFKSKVPLDYEMRKIA